MLSLHGVGGWRDLDDLHFGELGEPGFEQAINNGTDGFIWYGTRRALSSRFINAVEIPLAVARKRREIRYPLVPLFVTVTPAQARTQLKDALTDEDFKTFTDANGAQRGRMTNDRFRAHVACGYLRSAVHFIDQEEFTIAVTAITEPDGRQDFTFDWRSVFDERSRVLSPGTLPILIDALKKMRDTLKPKAGFPLVTLDCDLPLPLAVLLGYEWRVTSRLRLRIRQRTRSGIISIDGDGSIRRNWPAWKVRDCGSVGACVLAVSTKSGPLTKPTGHYAQVVGANRIIEIHTPGELDAAGVRGLARHVAAKIGDLNSAGYETHLLLAGPCALAILVGAAANALGPITTPFWDGSAYVSPITVGT